MREKLPRWLQSRRDVDDPGAFGHSWVMLEQTFNRHLYRVLLGVVVCTLAIGTVVYHVVEKLSWVDAYYLSVVTLTTVGYGDLAQHTTVGKLFTTFYLFGGIGILTTFITYSMRRSAWRRQMKAERRD